MLYLVSIAVFALLVLTPKRRRHLRRWWQTKPCPTPGCAGRFPAEPLQDGNLGIHANFIPEQCEVCEGWAKWNSYRIPFAGYIRIHKGPKP